LHAALPTKLAALPKKIADLNPTRTEDGMSIEMETRLRNAAVWLTLSSLARLYATVPKSAG
jgi:hypothetical protein